MKPASLLPLLIKDDWWFAVIADEESSFSSSVSEPDDSSSNLEPEESSSSSPEPEESSSSSPEPEESSSSSPEPEESSSSSPEPEESSSSSPDTPVDEPSSSSSFSSSEPDGSSSVSCPSIEVNLYGRRQIGVNQFSSGSHYPFTNPSDNLELLIADLFLHYIDDNGVLEPPFKIDWLVGFGCLNNSSPVGQTNDYDIQISDANDVVVFNSQFATSFQTADWLDPNEDPYLKIIEWANDNGEVLRVVIFTAWEEEVQAVNWYHYFEPTSGELDSRAVEHKPRAVRSFAVKSGVGETNVSGENIKFKAGYNLKFELEEVADNTDVDGGELVRVIDVDVDPGQGLGRFPGCEQSNTIKKINNIEPDQRGNFLFDVSECYRLEVPITNLSSEAVLEESTLKFANNCSPCCDCEEYRRIYEAIRRLDARYRQMAVRAEAARDQYKLNRDRWQKQVACRQANRIRTAIQPVSGCLGGIAAGICNLETQTPLKNVELRVSFTYSDDDDVTAATTATGCLICNSVLRKGNTDPTSKTGANRLLPYVLAGDWPVYKAYFDCIHPGNVGYITFLLEFADCTTADTLEMVVEVFDSSGSRLYGPVKDSASLIPSYSEPDCCSLGV